VHPSFGVEIARGLVGQQDGGSMGQGPGEGDPLLLASAKRRTCIHQWRLLRAEDGGESSAI
jgi:hypothetical protein